MQEVMGTFALTIGCDRDQDNARGQYGWCMIFSHQRHGRRLPESQAIDMLC